MQNDEQHLKVLSIFHYVAGGITALFALLPSFHVLMGLFMLFAPSDSGDAFARMMGLLFILFGGVFILGGWALAACMIAVGRLLALRRRYTFCLIVAGVECIFMPIGTALGIFSLIVLLRPSVQKLFGDIA